MNRGYFQLNACILSSASAVGKKESQGPLQGCFDYVDPTDRFGKKTWESSESEMQRFALNLALGKASLHDAEVGALFAGDLLNQCVGSAYGLLSFNIPYFGLYGACSTCAESLLLASLLVSGGFCRAAAAVTSSHYCSAERQYRTPLEYGGQRSPTAQWTVTGAGAFLVGDPSMHPSGVRIARGMPGIAHNSGISDSSNMGAAMAPSAADTLLRYLSATGEEIIGYDRIVTGDLGFEGGALFRDLLYAEGVDLADRYADCGQLIYDRKRQDVHAGGSGCGCSAVVLASHLLPKLRSGEYRKILFLATGAMMNPDSVKQGESIPSIAHLLELTCAESVGDGGN